ncbi:serine-rich adhesin for platelets [Anabrus simplex]|uniref:serine-rich adhesin for platelets n=1 Tax=Anabrus simplex TaxID=316456 RepID=UPI0035A366D1
MEFQTDTDLPPSLEKKASSEEVSEEISYGNCVKSDSQVKTNVVCGTDCTHRITDTFCQQIQDRQSLVQNSLSLSSVVEMCAPVKSNLDAEGVETNIASELMTWNPNPVLNKTLVGDGSDSGCCCAGHVSSLQRALSSNSGGYASSCGGLEDTTPAVSCDSSLISCYSSYEDTEDMGTSTTVLLLHGGDGTSEGGSESSSVTDKDLDVRNRAANAKRCVTTNTSRKRSDARKTESDVSRAKTAQIPPSRTGATTTHRTTSTAQGTCAGRKREKAGTVTTSLSAGTRLNVAKQLQSGNGTKPSTRLTAVSSLSARARSKTANDNGSHGTVKKETATIITKGRNNARTVCSVRNKADITSASDDGRWPPPSTKSVSTPRSRGGSLAESQSKKSALSSSSSIGTNGTIIESKASALEKYATLPRRRRRESPENYATENHQRSHSVSRDPSLNRAASLRKQHHQKDRNLGKALPPYPRRKIQGRTRIFHEISVQTALTADDVTNALAGIGIQDYIPVRPVERQDQEVQVDEGHKEMEHLTAQLQLLQADCDQQKQELHSVEAEKLVLKEELDNTNKRVLAMLGNVEERGEGLDSLQELELQLQSTDSTVAKQQHKITDLQALCHTLQQDLEKSLAAQKILMQQQQEMEAESVELHEFLQAEKLTLSEALQEGEGEILRLKQQLMQREADLQRQQEECKHLVRISEQRRQESLAFQARLNGLEKRSKELLLQQGAAVSGAAVALSGLTSRLDGLVEQLVSSYNISEKDLEVVGAGINGRNMADVIFHNEAYSKSNSSVEASPEKTSCDQLPNETSPKCGASFVTAVISAIKNATAQSSFSNDTGKHEESAQISSPEGEEHSESVVKDPCISPDCGSSSRLGHSESLHNLSQAILIRQQSEMAQRDGGGNDEIICNKSEDVSPVLEDCCSAASLVDQIIDVDNLVTKLLKVLRILQLENDTCIGELTDERRQLAEQVRREEKDKEDTADALWNWECLGARLRSELEEARLQLEVKVKELEETKLDVRHYREEVERLSRDVCKLSSLCQRAELQLRSREEEAEKALKQWQQTGHLPPADTLARILAASNEALQSIQAVIMQCPPLANLQKLEETNFQNILSLPVVGSDFNANAALVTTNGTSNAINPV